MPTSRARNLLMGLGEPDRVRASQDGEETMTQHLLNTLHPGFNLCGERSDPKTLHEELSEVLAKHGLVLGKNCILSLI